MSGATRKHVLWAGVAAAAAVVVVAWYIGGGRTPASDGATAPANPAAIATTDLAQLAVRTGLALAAIVGLIVVAAWAVRRFAPRGTPRSDGALAVVDRLDLGPRRAVVGLRAGPRIVLLGVTDTQITALVEFSAAEAQALYPPGGGSGQPGPFAGLLRGVLSQSRSG